MTDNPETLDAVALYLAANPPVVSPPPAVIEPPPVFLASEPPPPVFTASAPEAPEPTPPEPSEIHEAIAGSVSFSSDPTPPLPAPVLADYQAAIDAHVEAIARARSYNSAASCAGYAASTVPAWAAEAAAFIAWRDAVWIGVYAALAAVQGGAPAPSVDALVAGLPAMVWPA